MSNQITALVMVLAGRCLKGITVHLESFLCQNPSRYYCAVPKRTGYDVLTHGISFTVLPPVAKSYASKGWAPRLIYSNNHHVFLSRSNLFDGIREPIEGLSALRTWIQGKDPK